MRYETPGPPSEAKLGEVEAIAASAPANAVVEITALPAPASLMAAPSSDLALEAASTGTDHHFGFTPDAGFPLTGEVYWFAERIGPGGPTTTGVTVTPDGSDPTQVTIHVEDGLVGEVLVYLSYQTTGGKLVFGVPTQVALLEPAGASLVGIDLQPTGRTFSVDQVVRPDVIAIYDDGTELRRIPAAVDLGPTTSSTPAVVDASDPLAWRIVGEGDSVISLTAFGFTDTALVIAVDPFPPLTEDEWLAENYSPEELANPLVSGPDADRDGDNVSVGFEYLTGGSDGERDPSVLPRVFRDESGLFFTVRVSTRLAGVEGLQVIRSEDLGAPLQDWIVHFDFRDPIDLADPRILDRRDYGGYLEVDFAMPMGASGKQFIRLFSIAAPEPGPATGTTILTFEGAGSTDYAYGNRVATTPVGSWTYGGAPDFTPRVEARYDLAFFTGTFADGANTTFAMSGADGLSELRLTADPGYLVQLESFDGLVRWSRFGSAPTLSSITLRDGEGTLLLEDNSPTIPLDSHLNYDLGPEPPLAEELVLLVDGSNLVSSLRDEVGFDNVRFSQRMLRDFGDSTELTFDYSLTSPAGIANTASYGDRVSGYGAGPASYGTVSYRGTGGFTPQVTVDYATNSTPTTGSVLFDGYGTLRQALVGNDTLEIALTADPGHQVQLHRFDLAVETDEYAADPAIQSLRIEDGAGTPLDERANLVVSKDTRTRISFIGSPLQAAQLVIELDFSNLSGNGRRLAIDNLLFSQVEVP